MLAQALGEQAAKAAALPPARDRLSLVLKVLMVERRVAPHLELEVRGDLARVEGEIERGLAPLGLFFKIAAGADAEDPEFPGIDDVGRLDPFLEIDREQAPHRRPGGVGDEPHLEDRDIAPADLLFRVGRAHGAEELVVRSRVGAEPDEGEAVLRPAASRRLGRDQDVDVRLFTVPDVVDEGDLRADVIDIAMIAIDEDFGRGLLELGDVGRFLGPGRGPPGPGRSSGRHGPSVHLNSLRRNAIFSGRRLPHNNDF